MLNESTAHVNQFEWNPIQTSVYWIHSDAGAFVLRAIVFESITNRTIGIQKIERIKVNRYGTTLTHSDRREILYKFMIYFEWSHLFWFVHQVIEMEIERNSLRQQWIIDNCDDKR